jgi:organic radical activating enzyme
MPTYQCTAACKHCGSYSGPKVNQWLDPDLMLAGIDQAIDAGYKVVVFTGGEPTLAGETLLRGIRLASSRGVCTRVVTNAWWATGEEAADAKLKELIDAGLVEINFSTGDEHARFVPVDNVLWACRAAAKIPLKTIVVMVETVAARTITSQTLFNHPQYRQIRREFPRANVRVIQSPWMPISPQMTTQYPDGMATVKKNLPAHTGCTSCLRTTTLGADGRIGVCCGLGMRSIPELQVGRIGEITIAEADRLGEDDFLKRWIQVEGPERILAWAATKNPEIQWEGMYAHRCQSCMRLYKDPKVRQVIADHHQEKMADVILGEFLLYEYDYARANDETAGEGAGSDEPWPFAIAENGEAAAGLDLPAAPAPVTTSQPESFPIVV